MTSPSRNTVGVYDRPHPLRTRKVIVPGMNHILLNARTGDPDEYDELADQTISASAVEAIVAWLKETIK